MRNFLFIHPHPQSEGSTPIRDWWKVDFSKSGGTGMVDSEGFLAKEQQNVTARRPGKGWSYAGYFEAVTAQLWAKNCRHVIKVEDYVWRKEGLQEDTVHQVLIEIKEELDNETLQEFEDDINEEDAYLGHWIYGAGRCARSPTGRWRGETEYSCLQGWVWLFIHVTV